MQLSTILIVLVIVWAVSAFLCARIAAKKARGVNRWLLLGIILGPIGLLIQACYPARYKPEMRACPQCAKMIGVRAVACHFCQYRFPAVDVMITRAPTDADSRRSLLNEIAREYGIPYADATLKLDQLPMAGYRHVLPDQVSEYVRRLEATGATVSVVPSTADVTVRGPQATGLVIRGGGKSASSPPR